MKSIHKIRLSVVAFSAMIIFTLAFFVKPTFADIDDCLGCFWEPNLSMYQCLKDAFGGEICTISNGGYTCSVSGGCSC